jgi:hypothetical protein
MKRRFISRIFGLLFAYFVIFMLLSLVQFTSQDNLNRQIGALRINGSLRRQGDGVAQQQTGSGREYFIQDGVRLSFGGLEFKLQGSVNNGLAYVDSEGLVQAAYPEALTISDNEVRCRLSDGQQLSFYADNSMGTKNLTISALITGDVEQILVPFKAYGRASIERGELNDIVVSYGNDEYVFEAGNIDEDRGLISLSRADPAVFYHVILDYDTPNITEFIVSGSTERQIFNETVQKWCDAAFDYWRRIVNTGNVTESTIASYLAEAARRGVLSTAVGTLPASIRNGNYTFLLAPFLGRLNGSMRGLLTNEQESISRIASFSIGSPSSFLTGENIFEYLYERGNQGLFDSGIGYVKSLNPSTIDVKMCAGIFEGWLVWNKWMDGVETENPFDKFLYRARELVSANMKKDDSTGYVFLVDGTIDILYNIRLGAALANFSEATGNNGWAAVGRSLIVSALSLTDNELSLNAELEISADGSFVGAASSEKLSAAQIYHELRFYNFYPHAFGTGRVSDDVWLWTISPEIRASFQNNVLDFGIDFPPGGTHYIYILNIKPFSRIQLRNMDWRSDPQFEQYNAPGWRYSTSEQVLMVKMVQQNDVEHIRIVF